ncbi:MAG: nucleotidyltransferase domain-containing protein [Desulfitobacterium hafniense]|nr:nucleotidyltransferase domain-containing protein [Desulfitobacterium hafniense]
MSFGLNEQDLTFIVSTIVQFNEIKKAMIFGSRAKGNYKPGSDVDIAIFGDDITFDTISRLHAVLEDDSPMPYFFDIVDYSHLTHEELKEHIERVGKIIFQR